MKLLIITQVVDTRDPVLGFFVRWIQEFARHAAHVEVICLKEGKYELPANVRVHSLGKERNVSRIAYILNFYRYIWSLRHEYDAVFVHMNPEYVVLGGLWWRLWHKRIVLWYTHKNIDVKLRIATLLAHGILTASKESFRLRSRKMQVVGHGIDTEFFSPDENISRGTAVLSVGRLSQIKRHDLVIHAAEHFPNDVRIAGEGPERQHLEALVGHLLLAPRVCFLGAQTQEQLRGEYRAAGVFVHMSETGSLDKVVLEALACGLPVITTNCGLQDLPITVISSGKPDVIAKEVLVSRDVDGRVLAKYVQEHHSLQRLVPAILTSIMKVA